jgi:hypothetical protein
MKRLSTGRSRVGRSLSLMAVVSAAVGWQEPPEPCVDFRDEVDPRPDAVFWPSGEAEFQAFARLSDDENPDLTVRLLVLGRAEPHRADTLKLIPEMARGYDRDFSEDATSFWVALNMEGRA